MGKWCLHASSFIFDGIFIKVACNQDTYKGSDVFKTGPLVSMAHLYVFGNKIWPWHIGLRWAIVALWATCLDIFRDIKTTFFSQQVDGKIKHVCVYGFQKRYSPEKHYVSSSMRYLVMSFLSLSHDMTKPTKWVCPQRRLRSAWAFAQSDQSLGCMLNG